ncbi:MAG: hypothetical protein IPL39_00025 [Opitutaceae bacterium]|nr:hypothetical protein [Opitutaceae bacterium]
MKHEYPSLLRVLLVFGLLGPLLGGLAQGCLLAGRSMVQYDGADVVFRIIVTGFVSLVFSVILSLPVAFIVYLAFRKIALYYALSWYLCGVAGIIVGCLFSVYPFVIGYRDLRLCLAGACIGFCCGLLCVSSSPKAEKIGHASDTSVDLR